jgi:hypothetical protein
MSNWSHVAGIIRVDDIQCLYEDNFNVSNVIKAFLGKEIDFDSPEELWEEYDKNPDNFMPSGSEGSLNSCIYVNPDKSCMAAYVVSVFGDLRDHDDLNSIVEWFKDKVSVLDEVFFSVRNAVIIVEDDHNGIREWHK